MRFEYLLNEIKKIIISKKEAPDWVKPILGNSYPNIDVIVKDVHNLYHWHDADVMDVYFFVGDGKGGGTVTNSYTAASEDNFINSDKESQALHTGTEVKLWPNSVYGKPMMILVTHTYPKKAELLVHPENIPKQLESDKEPTDLSKEELSVLAIIKGFVSSYRKDYYRRYRIKNYEEIINKLKEKGYLSGNGGISIKGKNYLQNFDNYGSTESFIEKILK